MLCTRSLRRYAGVIYSVIPLGGDVGLIDPKMLVAMILMRGFRWISDALIHHLISSHFGLPITPTLPLASTSIGYRSAREEDRLMVLKGSSTMPSGELF